MNYRQFGKTGLQVSEIGFGAWQIAGGWGQNDEKPENVIQRAYDSGINFYDSAYVYSDGDSEAVLGKVLKPVRDKVVFASKVPPKNFNWAIKKGDNIKDSFPANWIIECTERSLKKFNTDVIDIQQLHSWNDTHVANDEWLNAFTKLQQQGKVRFFGISMRDWEPYDGIELVQSGLIHSVQIIYNIFEQRPEEKLLPAAIEHGVGIIVRVPFEEGLLTGKFRPGHQFSTDDWRKNWMKPDRLVEVDKRLKAMEGFLGGDTATFTHLALKYILHHPAVSTVIPGMRKLSHVDDNVIASTSTPLGKDVVEELHNHKFVHGWMYPWAKA